MESLRLRADARRARVLRGHPWVFDNELAEKPPTEWDGAGVALYDGKGRLLGSGLCNSRSKIVWRKYSSREKALDEAYLGHLLQASLKRRLQGPLADGGKAVSTPGHVGRLVWSEADDLPGLIVDQYGDILVIQAQTLGMDQRLPDITRLLRQQLEALQGAPVRDVLYRNDAPSREFEGLPLDIRTESGEPLEERWLEIDGVAYCLDLQKAHKTGFYLDQREEHLAVATLAKGRRVLDGFCHMGAFALQCARAGAANVKAVDSSPECLEYARRNAQQNNLSVEWVWANMFDYFTANRDERFDLIVLDPPSFARNRGALQGALRGYKELNLRALKALNPGGILATYSCSQHVTRELFQQVLTDAASDAGRKTTLERLTGQPADHPVVLGIPETEYLKGAVLRVE